LSTVQRATKLEFHMNEGNIITRGISYIFILWLCSYIAGLIAKAGGAAFFSSSLKDFYLRSTGMESRSGHRLFLLSFFMLLVRPFEQIPRQYLD